MLDFRIATFLKLCETKSYTKTAKMLNITQPSVTQHIKYLQKKYQCKLFIYEGKTLSLTEEGEYLRSQAETMTKMSAKVISDLQRMNDSNQALRFGCPSEIGEAVVTRIIAELMELDYVSDLSICIKNTSELLDMLENGQLDVILADENYHNNQFASVPMSNVRYAVYAQPERAEKYNKPVLKDFMQERLLVREQGASDREILEYYLSQNGMLANEFYDVMTASTAVSLQELAIAGAGILFAYASSVKDAVAQNRLQELTVSDFSAKRSLVFLYCKENKNQEEFSEFFEDFTDLWNKELKFDETD
ncbi:MAG: LysR family transcriptional regulator [Oscillospiraceae bacterium]|nr:LysR family transcriptional regulator [Oscillospiraceae bacterium]